MTHGPDCGAASGDLVSVDGIAATGIVASPTDPMFEGFEVPAQTSSGSVLVTFPAIGLAGWFNPNAVTVIDEEMGR